MKTGETEAKMPECQNARLASRRGSWTRTEGGKPSRPFRASVLDRYLYEPEQVEGASSHS